MRWEEAQIAVGFSLFCVIAPMALAESVDSGEAAQKFIDQICEPN